MIIVTDSDGFPPHDGISVSIGGQHGVHNLAHRMDGDRKTQNRLDNFGSGLQRGPIQTPSCTHLPQRVSRRPPSMKNLCQAPNHNSDPHRHVGGPPPFGKGFGHRSVHRWRSRGMREGGGRVGRPRGVAHRRRGRGGPHARRAFASPGGDRQRTAARGRFALPLPPSPHAPAPLPSPPPHPYPPPRATRPCGCGPRRCGRRHADWAARPPPHRCWPRAAATSGGVRPGRSRSPPPPPLPAPSLSCLLSPLSPLSLPS